MIVICEYKYTANCKRFVRRLQKRDSNFSDNCKRRRLNSQHGNLDDFGMIIYCFVQNDHNIARCEDHLLILERVFIENLRFYQILVLNSEPARIEYRQYLYTSSIKGLKVSSIVIDPSLIFLFTHMHVFGCKNVNVFFPYRCRTIGRSGPLNTWLMKVYCIQ